MTTEEIKKDLKTIRGYYAERQALESEFLLLPHKTTKLVQAYADAIYDAPLDLYRVYFALYVKGLTQEAAAEELNYCTEYIRQKNKKLLEYLRENITVIAQQIVERHDEKAGNYTMSLDFRTPRTPELDELYNRWFAGRMRLNGWRLRTDVRTLHGLR